MAGEKGDNRSFWEANEGSEWKIGHQNPGTIEERKRSEREYAAAWQSDSEAIKGIFQQENMEQIFAMEQVDAITKALSEYPPLLRTERGQDIIRRFINVLRLHGDIPKGSDYQTVLARLEALDSSLNETAGEARLREMQNDAE